jgi:hypothetical protein
VAEKLYFHQLTDRDRIATNIVTGHAGTVDHYSLQLECRLTDSDEWTPIRRYDCSHDVVHTHVFSANSETQRIVREGMLFKDGLQLAHAELTLNWERYRQDYGEGT